MPNIVKEKSNWICCQIGAREHYAIPRALQAKGLLGSLITDSWVNSERNINNIIFSRIPKFKERSHPSIPSDKVIDFTVLGLKFELKQRLKRISDWPRIMNRNEWFQKQTTIALKKLNFHNTSKPILFAYSYAALDIFRYAKGQGWTTVLGQIDPGIVETLLVNKEHKINPKLSKNWQPIPNIYWENWKKECLLADVILVNSTWSKKALIKANINQDKIEVIPLAYSTSKLSIPFKRQYPETFSAQRPLKVLFLGQVILRKGISAILATIEHLKDLPIEFVIVGRIGVNLPRRIKQLNNVHFLGSIARSETIKYYQISDVFLLPTISDGFAITQLEAISWKLPIIASKNCGRVVSDGVNGRLLDEITMTSIVNALLDILKNPSLLRTWSDNTKLANKYSLEMLGRKLNEIIQ